MHVLLLAYSTSFFSRFIFVRNYLTDRYISTMLSKKLCLFLTRGFTGYYFIEVFAWTEQSGVIESS